MSYKDKDKQAARKAAQAAYHEAHKEKQAAYQAAYQAARKEMKAAHRAAYYASHKEEMKAYTKAYNAARRVENIKALSEIHELKCAVCGFDKSFSALDFHHLDPSQKKHSLDSMGQWIVALNTQRFIDKVKSVKLMVLCSNCHKMYHAGEIELPTEG